MLSNGRDEGALRSRTASAGSSHRSKLLGVDFGRRFPPQPPFKFVLFLLA